MTNERAKATRAKQNDFIRRLITNQREEHTPHAFRAGHAGMHDFNRVVPILRSLPVEEVHAWLDLIDDVADSHRACAYCLGKITAYRILITQDIEPLAERHAGYLSQYARLLANQRHDEQRDFIKEVIDSMYRGKEHPHRQVHAFHWHEIAETISCDGRHQLDKNGPRLTKSGKLKQRS